MVHPAIMLITWNEHPARPLDGYRLRGSAMLCYALVFLAMALTAGLLGFGVVAGISASVAQVLFFLFLVLFLAALLVRLVRGA